MFYFDPTYILVLIGLSVGLEVNRVADVFHPGKNMRDRGISPQTRVIVELPCRRIHTHPLGVGSGIFDFTLGENISNLRRSISVHCEVATRWGKANGYKEWRYLFIPSKQVMPNSSFMQLAKQFHTL